jgi:aryl-alcohol dehydrogenase-like predicted oxidoreductase
MQYRILGKTGLSVSRVIYGGIVSMLDGQDLSDQYVAWAIDHGINYFDVAPTYGDAQEKLGNSLLPYRSQVYLACKTTQRDAANAEAEMRESMHLLHTDYFDNYQMHALTSVEEVKRALQPDGCLPFFAKMREEGTLRHLGITCHSEEAALYAMENFPFDTLMFPLNWHMNMGYGFGSRAVQAARENGMGILAIKELIERRWKDEKERTASPWPKSWCKPIDADDTELRIAAMKYTLSLGVDVLDPPGDFSNFSFVVSHIDECLASPLNDQDRDLLRSRYEKVKDFPFFEINPSR